jgi:hypothetical protein
MLGISNSEAAILSGSSKPQAYTIAQMYANRDCAVPTLQIDSVGLNLTPSYDLTLRSEVYNSSEIDGTTYDQPAQMPTAVVQILPTTTKANAIAALNNIIAAVQASSLLS